MAGYNASTTTNTSPSGHILREQVRRGGETRPGTEKRCSHNLQNDPLGSGFKKWREDFPY